MPSFLAGFFLKMRPPEGEPIDFISSEVDFWPEDEASKDLSLRELEVLSLVATGSCDRDIARKLAISEQTTHNHMGSIKRKMAVDNRTEAALVFQYTCLATSFENPNFTLAEFQDRLLQTAQNKETWVFGLAELAQERFGQGGEEEGHFSKIKIEILALIAHCLFNKEIAPRLGISLQVTKNLVSSILRKMNVDNRTEAALVFQRTIFSLLLERLHFTPEEFQDRLFQTAQEGSWRLVEIRSRLEEQIETRKPRFRERRGQIVQQLAEGKTIKEIAASLGGSDKAIKHVVFRLYKKFGIDTHDPHRRELLVEKARETGLIA